MERVFEVLRRVSPMSTGERENCRKKLAFFLVFLASGKVANPNETNGEKLRGLNQIGGFDWD